MVRYLPSKLSALKMNKAIAQEVGDIMSELSRLKNDMAGLHLEVVHQPTLNLIDTRETCSFIQEDKIVGRDEDREVIVGLLLDSYHFKEGLLVVPIVGMGGLGKTALAQLVFNDRRVQQHFQCRYWVCISDKLSDLKELIGRVLHSMVRDKEWNKWSLENLQSKVREVVKEKQFLLVLDDIWDEHIDWMVQLRDLLCEGRPGSAVVVTCRSELVASNIGTVECYKLQGLTEDQSWALFRSLALREGQEEKCPDLASVGRKITKKCGNIPLAIRTIAGLLFSRHTEQEWVHFRDREIGVIDQNKNGIIPTLELSYYHLSPQLKQCFAYCSLYPKGYEFKIQDLIWRWLAQGYISSSNDGHVCFMELLRRCFFQDVKTAQCGTMVCCKMHDLMHDLALKVGDECLLVDHHHMGNINSNIRHVAVTLNTENPSIPLETPWRRASLPSRSIWLQLVSTWYVKEICLHFKRLRVLDLDTARYGCLPDSIQKLKHLRYLKANVSCLPKGITRLQNLQTLDVSVSEGRLDLASDFTKLTSLRHLITTPFSLNEMPPRFGQLEHLETLNNFVVGGNNGLNALSRMNLTGFLHIDFRANRENAISEVMMANLKSKKVTHLSLDWWDLEEQADSEADELLNCLSPPSTLKRLDICGFKGVRLSWGIHEFASIVGINIYWCIKLQYLPSFSRMPHLKTLVLNGLDALEYVEAGRENNFEIVSSSSSRAEIYFPSLEILVLRNLPNLLGWFRIEDTAVAKQLQQYCQPLAHFFPRLLLLEIWECPKLTSVFAAQNWRSPLIIENLYIRDCEELDLWVEDGNGGDSSNSVNYFSAWQSLTNVHSLTLGDMSRLEALPNGIAALTQLQSLLIDNLASLETLPDGIGQLTQLHSLVISDCPELESLPTSILNLTALQELEIRNCPALAQRCEEPDGEYWPLIQHITSKIFDDDGEVGCCKLEPVVSAADKGNFDLLPPRVAMKVKAGLVELHQAACNVVAVSRSTEIACEVIACNVAAAARRAEIACAEAEAKVAKLMMMISSSASNDGSEPSN